MRNQEDAVRETEKGTVSKRKIQRSDMNKPYQLFLENRYGLLFLDELFYPIFQPIACLLESTKRL